MTAKVIPIRGHELIPVLEEWLEQAKRGEIRAMAFAAIMDDENTCEGWAGRVDECCLALFAAINILRDGYFHQHIDHYSNGDRGGV